MNLITQITNQSVVGRQHNYLFLAFGRVFLRDVTVGLVKTENPLHIKKSLRSWSQKDMLLTSVRRRTELITLAPTQF